MHGPRSISFPKQPIRGADRNQRSRAVCYPPQPDILQRALHSANRVSKIIRIADHRERRFGNHRP